MDGQMATDDHRAMGGGAWTFRRGSRRKRSRTSSCAGLVTSTLLGSATAHARVFLGGDGWIATNPWKTPKPVRWDAPWIFGYGLYGTGYGVGRRGPAGAGRAGNPIRSAAGAEGSERLRGRVAPPSQRQLQFVRDLLERTGMPADDVEAHGGGPAHQLRSIPADQAAARARHLAVAGSPSSSVGPHTRSVVGRVLCVPGPMDPHALCQMQEKGDREGWQKRGGKKRVLFQGIRVHARVGVDTSTRSEPTRARKNQQDVWQRPERDGLSRPWRWPRSVPEAAPRPASASHLGEDEGRGPLSLRPRAQAGTESIVVGEGVKR